MFKGLRVRDGIVGLATVIGPAVTTRLGLPIGVLTQLCWVCGLLIGLVAAYKREQTVLVNSVSEHVEGVDPARIRRVIAAQLFRQGSSAAESYAIAEFRKMEAARVSPLPKLHDFIHSARDNALKQIAVLESGLRRVLSGEPAEIRKSFTKYLNTVLVSYHALLSAVTKETTGLYVAVRALQEDEDGQPVYVTILRAGSVDESKRAGQSRPIPANKGLPSFLLDDLNSGTNKKTRGVVFLTPDDKKDARKWLPTPNDQLDEDRYLVAAPITVRTLNEVGSLNTEMAMILYACHEKDIFRPSHRDLIRCCVDTLSLAISVALQLANAAASATPSKEGFVKESPSG